MPFTRCCCRCCQSADDYADYDADATPLMLRYRAAADADAMPLYAER